MSNTVDNRAVHLGFDNKEFEAGVKQSTASLDTLKKGLDLNEQAKSLNNLANAGKSFNLGPIADGVQNISNKFSALGVIGFTVIQNLTNAAIELGQKIWTSITAPAKQGFGEYETQMNAIQTILANTAAKGTTLQQVNDILNVMNEYADKTIYSFPEMARNMGTFTAAGIELNTAADAIKGIANLAAVSGSNSQQAATAMYQLSQALSSGTVKLMDWNSVVNAGMGGQVFQDALKETARLHGVAIDDMIKKEGSFRNTLQEGWLTSQILTETLAKFTGDLSAEQLKTMGYTEEQIAGIIKLGETANDAATKVKTLSQLRETMQEALQSGWAQSWQIIVGDFGEAKELFTYLSDTFGAVIQKSSDTRNAMLQGWKDLGGRTLLIDTFKNALATASTVINIFKMAWAGWFPSTGKQGETLFKITQLLSKFVNALKPTSTGIKNIVAIAGGLMAIIDIIRMGIIALIGNFTGLNTKGLKPLIDNFTKYIQLGSAYLINLRNSIKENNSFGNAIENVKTRVEGIKESFEEFKKSIIIVIDRIRSKFEELKGAVEIFKENIKKAFTFKKVDTGPLTGFLDKLKERINFKPLETLLKVIDFVFNGLISLLEKSGPTLLKIGSFIAKVLGNLGNAVMESVSELDFSKLFDMINEGLFGGLLIALTRFVNSGSLQAISGMFGGVSAVLDQVRASLQAYQQNLKSQTLLNIAIAVGILAASLLVLSLIDSTKLTIALLAITTLFADLTLSMKGMSGGGGGLGGAAGLAASLIGMSIAILLITAAVKSLADLDPKQLKNGLLSLSAISAELVLFSKIVGQNAKSFIGTAVSLVILGVALELMVNVVNKLGNIKPDVLKQGLIALGAILAEFAAFSQLVGNIGIGKGVGILALSASILIIYYAVEKFGKMDVKVLKQGLIAIGAILLGIAAFTRLSGSGANFIATGVGLAIVAASMLIFYEAISKMGKLSWEEIGRGMAVMAGALALITASMNLMPKNMILSAVGLVLVGGAIYILTQALLQMKDMTWEEIGKGLVTLAGSLAIITLAMIGMQGAIGGAVALLLVSGALTILTPVLKTLGSMGITEIAIALGALAAMFLIFGIAGYALTPVVPTLLGLAAAIFLIGVAVAAIGAGVLLFSTGLAALAISGVAGATAFVAIVGILLGMIPMIITAIGNAIVAFAKMITAAAPAIGEALLAILLMLCEVIITAVPPLLEALTVLLEALWQLIREQVPQAVDAILYVVGELLKSLAEKIPEFTQSAFDILLGFLKGIRDNIGEVVIVVGEIVTEFLDALALKIPDIIQAGFDLLVSFIDGITKAISSEDNKATLAASITNLANAIITGLTDGLLGGIQNIIDAIGKISSGIIDALKTLLGITSPSKVTREIGEQTVKGLVIGLRDRANSIGMATERLSKKTISGMSGAIRRINDTLNSNLDANPTIRPILDLTNVEQGGRNIDDILGKRSILLSRSIDTISDAAIRMGYPNGGNEKINTPKQGTVVTFNQTNNSPKALSSFDIYRETRNQLLMLKGLVVSE